MPYKCEWKLPAGTFPFIYFNWNMYLSKTLWWRVKQVVRGRDYIHLIIIGTKNSKMQKTYLILGCIVVEISLLSYRTIFRTSFHFRLQIEKKYLEKNKRKMQQKWIHIWSIYVFANRVIRICQYFYFPFQSTKPLMIISFPCASHVLIMEREWFTWTYE